MFSKNVDDLSVVNLVCDLEKEQIVYYVMYITLSFKDQKKSGVLICRFKSFLCFRHDS